MFFLFHNGKRYLDLGGNLIFTHNAAMIRGNNKKATPQSITDGVFLQILPTTGFMVRFRATLSALAFIWGATKARTPQSDIEYLERLRHAEKTEGEPITDGIVTDMHDPEKIEKALTKSPDNVVPIKPEG